MARLSYLQQYAANLQLIADPTATPAELAAALEAAL